MSPTLSQPPAPPAIGSLEDLRHRHLHFVGIGGCGMSGLARLLKRLGVTCSGSDQTSTPLTDRLTAEGIAVSFDQQAGRLPAQAQVIVRTAAVKDDHPELVAAASSGLPILGYAQTLGLVQAAHSGVSIAGTHGKSTTTAMLCHALIECGLDPSFIVGADCPQIGGGSRIGSPRIPSPSPLAGRPGLLLAEACEFNRSFHHHRPLRGLISNIEEDHLDVYGTLDKILEAFHDFARLIPPASEGGCLLIHHEDAHREVVTANLACDVTTFGLSADADYQVEQADDERSVTLRHHDVAIARWTNSMPGLHNTLNSAAAAIIANDLGGSWDDIARALSGFAGLTRRLQRLGHRPVAGGHVVVYDDYGHHPTEIRKTLGALRAAEKPKRLICVFQPHQHSRTRHLLDRFASSFDAADQVIVPHIYFVRDSEQEKQRVRARDLVDRLRARGVRAMHLYPFEAIVEQLEVLCRPDDLVVIMGAGPVDQVAHGFMTGGRTT